MSVRYLHLSGCRRSSQRRESEAGLTTNRPGSSIGLIYLSMPNVSGKPLTLERAVLHGRGLGTVVKVIHLQVDSGGCT